MKFKREKGKQDTKKHHILSPSPSLCPLKPLRLHVRKLARPPPFQMQQLETFLPLPLSPTVSLSPRKSLSLDRPKKHRLRPTPETLILQVEELERKANALPDGSPAALQREHLRMLKQVSFLKQRRSIPFLRSLSGSVSPTEESLSSASHSPIQTRRISPTHDMSDGSGGWTHTRTLRMLPSSLSASASSPASSPTFSASSSSSSSSSPPAAIMITPPPSFLISSSRSSSSNSNSSRSNNSSSSNSSSNGRGSSRNTSSILNSSSLSPGMNSSSFTTPLARSFAHLRNMITPKKADSSTDRVIENSSSGGIGNSSSSNNNSNFRERYAQSRSGGLSQTNSQRSFSSLSNNSGSSSSRSSPLSLSLKSRTNSLRNVMRRSSMDSSENESTPFERGGGWLSDSGSSISNEQKKENTTVAIHISKSEDGVNVNTSCGNSVGSNIYGSNSSTSGYNAYENPFLRPTDAKTSCFHSSGSNNNNSNNNNKTNVFNDVLEWKKSTSVTTLLFGALGKTPRRSPSSSSSSSNSSGSSNSSSNNNLSSLMKSENKQSVSSKNSNSSTNSNNNNNQSMIHTSSSKTRGKENYHTPPLFSDKDIRSLSPLPSPQADLCPPSPCLVSAERTPSSASPASRPQTTNLWKSFTFLTALDKLSMPASKAENKSEDILESIEQRLMASLQRCVISGS